MTASSDPAAAPSPRRLDAAGEPLRLVHVHAHPDDESSKGAATSALYGSEGVEVTVVTCTGGERGSILNPAMDREDVVADLAGVRRAEMERAREILGVEQVWLGYVDSGLPEGDPLPPLPDGSFALADVDEAAWALVAILRRVRPHVLTTYDENGGYPHPDHIMCHKVSVRAYELCGLDERPELGEPWTIAKLYYDVGFHKEKFEALDAAMQAKGLESPYAERLRDWTWPERPVEPWVTTRVTCSEFFATRDAALLAHATQIDPDGHWFAVPLSLQSEAWPTEDFHLADSRVATSVPENDLFAGIETRVVSE